MKEGEQTFSMHSSLPKDYTDVVHMLAVGELGGSYRDKVLGHNGGMKLDFQREEREEDQGEEEEGERRMVEEHTVRDYECPAIIFSKKEEKRIYRPWRRSVIVKLLGRRIEYKALETRLKQMRNHKGSSGKNNMTADINAPTTKVNSITNFTGSIFDSLGDENPEVNGEGINGEETMKEPKLGDEDMGEVNENINRMHPKKLKIKRGNGATLAVNEEASPERINKETI
ncbi:hypothetical protein TSUD_322030 [Trifolium subterraneum]|uniref:Uncharacterized protein n=1 Tax=Trifolium subterraneum TaxID=3900 RepID=A0A2Z6ME93_TRISU|nr:hypothetical protein TSUD_322030 [Trifolium subterraneum]